MSTIIVVEPNALQRLGMLHVLSDITAEVVMGEDYSRIVKGPPRISSCDLVLLAVPAHERPGRLVRGAERVYAPKAIVLLLESDAMPLLDDSLSQTVAGVIPKTADPDVIQASVHLALAGGKCFTTQCDSANIEPTDAGHEATVFAPDAIHDDGTVDEPKMLGITRRQYEVLVLLAKGLPMKTVGRHMNISPATAKAHTSTLYERLNVHNRNAAVYAAISRGATLGWSLDGTGHLAGATQHASPYSNRPEKS